MAKKTKTVRLSKNIIPLKYKVLLAPDLDAFTFEGEEEIEVKVGKSTNKITLHAAELEILSAVISQNKKEDVGSISYNLKEETATLSFSKKINSGKAVLKMSFTGILNDKLRGFYRSRYEMGGKSYHMGVTQFESTDARRAIPCFDEPAHKAVFEVSLKVPSDRAVISNTIESEILEHDGGFKTVKFEPSPKMSSYLLAFIVGHFENIEAKTKSGVRVRVFVTPGKKHQAQFALEVGVKCIEFFEKYFGIKYPLPVMDLIAIPDFASGAMENWGAVTYRETAILVDPEHSSTQNKQWVALVIAHELAHQWFGNLVTMEWWTHLWLNEGFASYMEYVAIDAIFPEWHVWSQFVFIEEARGLLLDGLESTHAIEVDVNHPAEISEIFDAVSYSKGASVIRMLAEYLGEKDFQKGLSNYLKKHSYANASTNDLWEALGKVSGKPVKKIMQNWTRKPGYPLISVHKSKNGLELSQERFFSSSLIKKKDNSLWLVPVSIVSKENKPAYHLMKTNKLLINTQDNDWVKINIRETSFIRVYYTPELLKFLEMPVKDKKIGEEDRFGLIRDTFALSQSGKVSTVDALELATSYKNEDSYVVWTELASHVLKLQSILYGQDSHEPFRKYSRDLFSKIAKEVGWSKKRNETYQRTLLRSTILYILGASGDKKTIAQAQKLFNDVTFKSIKIDADIRGVVYRLVAENGGLREFNNLMSIYDNTSLAEEKDRVLRAICSFKDKKILEKVFEFALSDKARAQDLVKAFVFISANPAARDFAWKKLQENWQDIRAKFGGGHLFSRFVSPLDSLVTEEDAKAVELFFKLNPAEGLSRTVAQVVEQIRSNAAWLKRDGKNIKTFVE